MFSTVNVFDAPWCGWSQELRLSHAWSMFSAAEECPTSACVSSTCVLPSCQVQVLLGCQQACLKARGWGQWILNEQLKIDGCNNLWQACSFLLISVRP